MDPRTVRAYYCKHPVATWQGTTIAPKPVRTRIVRRIAADPSGTALLLSDTAAVELWPGVCRVDDGPVDDAALQVTVRTQVPRRTPTSYVFDFSFAGEGLPPTTGALTLAYAPSSRGTVETHAALVLTCDPRSGAGLDTARLRALGEGFLANLARAAERRSFAA